MRKPQKLRNLPYGFDIHLVNVKTIRRIAQNFVAFSEKLNFNENHQELPAHIEIISNKHHPGFKEFTICHVNG